LKRGEIKAMAENKTFKHASAIAQHCVEESHTIGKKKLIQSELVSIVLDTPDGSQYSRN